MRICFLFFFLSAVVMPGIFALHQANAAEPLSSPWQITADRIENIKEPERIIADGNVVIRRLPAADADLLEIKADHISYDVDKGHIETRGHVTIRTKSEQAKAAEAQVDLNSQTGTMLGATIHFKDNKLYFTGRRVEKTGRQTYHMEDGQVSSCETKPGKTAPWAVASVEGRVTLDGFAVLKHSTFRVKDFPLLYTPYLIFPALIDRQSGFLPPEISNSTRSGTGVLIPFFVNISPSADLTLYAGYLAKKGVNSAIEARYMEDYGSRGTLLANFLHDRTIDTLGDDFKSDTYLRDLHDRYWLRGKVDQDFGAGLMARLDIDVVSDRDYLQEYREGMTGFRQSNRKFLGNFHRGLQEESIFFRESTMQIGKTWSSVFLGGELRGVDDVLDEPSLTTEMQTLPRILFNARLPFYKMPFSLSWDTEYVNYWREEGVAGQRLDTHPGLIAPLPLGRYIEGKMVGGVRQTLYRLNIYGDETIHSWSYAYNKSRTVPDFSANVATVFSRDFGMVDRSTPRFTHTIRPNFKYTFVEAPDQSELPDFDGDDLVGSENSVAFELYNYFKLGERQEDGIVTTRDLGRFKISQSYNINEARRQLLNGSDKRRPFSDIVFDLTLYPLPQTEIRYQTELNVYGQGVTSYDLLTRYADKRGDSLAVDYRYVRDTVDEINYNAELALTRYISVKGGATQSLLNSNTVESTAALNYHPRCWAVEMQYSKNSDDQRVMVVFMLEGLGKAFEFGRSNL